MKKRIARVVIAVTIFAGVVVNWSEARSRPFISNVPEQEVKSQVPVYRSANDAQGVTQAPEVAQQANSESPVEALQGTIDRLLAIASDEQLKAPEQLQDRSLQLQTEVAKLFEVIHIGKIALGYQVSRSLTDEQLKSFLELYAPYFTHRYVRTMAEARGVKSKDVRYSVQLRPDGEALLATVTAVPQDLGGRKGVEEVYRMVLFHGKPWRVIGLKFNGNDMARRDSENFGNILKASSFDVLMQQLREKVEKLSQGR